MIKSFHVKIHLQGTTCEVDMEQAEYDALTSAYAKFLTEDRAAAGEYFNSSVAADCNLLVVDFADITLIEVLGASAE